jgi:aryl-alcohol dehydrogenase-like predicted oxidoreductase
LIAPDHDRCVLATKYTLSRDPNGAGNHRKSLVQALDASLKRLGTDYVDLLWVHIWDFLTPIEEVMRALDDQDRAGKVLYVGISDTPAWIVALQSQYSLVERTVERDLLPMCEALDLALTAWSPLGSGVLTGKYRSTGEARAVENRLAHPSTQGSGFRIERNLRIAETVSRVADEVGATPAQVALP